MPEWNEANKEDIILLNYELILIYKANNNSLMKYKLVKKKKS